MGCFLACFGSSKDRKRRNQSKNKVLPRGQLQRHGSQKPPQPVVSSEPEISAEPTNLILETHDKIEEQLSPSPRKKVTFDANIKTYDPVSVHESTEILPESNKDVEKQKEDCSGKSTLFHSLSEDGSSITSSVRSYPPNHRYQNCRDSDDEAEEFECEDSDLDEELEDYGDYDEDEDEDEDKVIVGQETWSKSIPTVSVESGTEISSARDVIEEVDSPLTKCGLPEQEVKKIGSNQNARDRSVYVHTVLNPVENLTQWKAVKSKGTSPLKPQKENFAVEQEAQRISFSFKSKSDQSKNQNQEIAVDASLSNWLVSSETTPTKKTSSVGLETITSERSTSPGSNSVISIEDRPILGALTVEELKQFSASSSSPRKSPGRSPDDMPIIGTVGTYWNHMGQARDSGSASSYKGIPNTTSKYREDKRVNWHSTPFETRLERTLNRRAAEP
ncbi:protein JASON-like isoform X1 [Camellia sinensis]|uniref:protein JASON-like isoform X1 n=1 Tax=Camellia sinensis TaxID=4442 RepID=UPI0010368C91|nr:protein JASON-like isoform X1 [Camellia sinensis]